MGKRSPEYDQTGTFDSCEYDHYSKAFFSFVLFGYLEIWGLIDLARITLLRVITMLYKAADCDHNRVIGSFADLIIHPQIY